MNTNYEQASRTRIKICGITRAQDLHQAAICGADAVGFVFYPKSKRYVSPVQASKLCGAAPAFLNTVALFVNPSDEDVETVINVVAPSVLQFHGDESPEQCASYGLPYIRAFRVGAPGLDTAQGIVETCFQYPHACAWLFDTFTPAYGGSGESFDYALLSELTKIQDRTRPLILSGGLKPETVGKALGEVNAWAVDVSSGVEESPGIKSITKMRAFIEAVNKSDSNSR